MKPWHILIQIREKLQQPSTLSVLVRGAIAALAIQLSSVGIAYLLQLLLAQWMGVDEYGVYEYAIAIGTVLAFAAGMGFSDAVLRFVSEYTVKQDWAHLRGIIWASWGQTLAVGLAISSLGTGLVLWISTWHDLENVTAIVLGIWTVPTFALAKLQLEIARGVRQIMLAYVPSLIVYPLLLIGGAYFWFQEQNHLTSVNAIAAPLFASLYAKGDLQGLQRLVSTIARWIFLPALIVAIGLIQFAEPILGLFGAEFIAAKWVMAALAFGQLVNVGAGSVGYLLIMTGHHNQCAYVMGFSALGNLILNLIWIPQMGILGAALATSLSMALWNIWMNRLVVKYLGVDPSILAALKSPS